MALVLPMLYNWHPMGSLTYMLRQRVTHIDDHHSNEDIALAIGTALLQALGDRKVINRFGHFTAPLDEAAAEVILDLSGRPHLSCGLSIPTDRVGTYDTMLVEHFFQSLGNTSGMTLHIRQALLQAKEYDLRRCGTVPSSKGGHKFCRLMKKKRVHAAVACKLQCSKETNESACYSSSESPVVVMTEHGTIANEITKKRKTNLGLLSGSTHLVTLVLNNMPACYCNFGCCLHVLSCDVSVVHQMARLLQSV